MILYAIIIILNTINMYIKTILFWIKF